MPVPQLECCLRAAGKSCGAGKETAGGDWMQQDKTRQAAQASQRSLHETLADDGVVNKAGRACVGYDGQQQECGCELAAHFREEEACWRAAVSVGAEENVRSRSGCACVCCLLTVQSPVLRFFPTHPLVFFVQCG